MSQGPQGPPTIRARARSREDRAGDPLDGLVNLFDLGIVLSLAFLLASLSSLNLDDDLVRGRADDAAGDRAPAGSIVVGRDQQPRTIQIRPGERVIGRGEEVGVVVRLSDGRTVFIPRRGADVGDVTGTTDGGATGGAATPPATTAP